MDSEQKTAVPQSLLAASLPRFARDYRRGQRQVGVRMIGHPRRIPGTLRREKRSIRRLAFDRVNVDGAQPPHPQHVHRQRASDAVAIENPDQIVDAVDIDPIEPDHDVAGQ